MTNKETRGRPKLPKAEKRSIMLSTRVNAAENKQIENAIKTSGKDKTVWMREALVSAAG